MICWFPCKSTFSQKHQKCKGRVITELQDITYWEQFFWATGDDKWLRNSSAPNSKVWVAERMLHLLWIINPAFHCASAQFRDTGWLFQDERATAGNHTINVQFCSFHCVSPPCVLNPTKCFSIPYKRQNSYRKGYNYTTTGHFLCLLQLLHVFNNC